MMSNASSSPSQPQPRPRAVSQPSIDLSYYCEDLTNDLEQVLKDAVGGGSFSDVYKYYRDRHAGPPSYFAVKQFRYNSSFKLTEEQTERVSLSNTYLPFCVLTDDNQRIKREIQSWINLKHSNILRLEGILYRGGSRFPCLVSQWMHTGTARRYCRSELSGANFMGFVSKLLFPVSDS